MRLVFREGILQPGQVIVIRDWQKHFEKSDTKKCVHTKWVPIPNKWDGKSYRRIMRMRDGTAIFCAWILIVQVASRCPKRGILADDDGPLNSVDLADKTGCKSEVFDRAIEVLASKEVGWIFFDSSPEIAGNFRDSPENAGLQDRTGQDKTEHIPPSEVCPEPPPSGDSKQSSDGSEVIMVFPCVGRGPTEWPLTDAKVAEYRQSFPAVDVLGECRKARQWCIDNPTKRKTFGGMAAFLTRWLSRCQDSGGSNGNSRGSSPGNSSRTGQDTARIRGDSGSPYDAYGSTPGVASECRPV